MSLIEGEPHRDDGVLTTQKDVAGAFAGQALADVVRAGGIVELPSGATLTRVDLNGTTPQETSSSDEVVDSGTA